MIDWARAVNEYRMVSDEIKDCEVICYGRIRSPDVTE